MRKLCIIILCVCFAVFMTVNYKFRDTEIKNVKIETYNISSVEECANTAKSILKLDDSVYLSNMGIIYENVNDSNPQSVNMTFVKINKYIFGSPYITYDITLDFSTKEACSIVKKYTEYIIYDDLKIENWNLDFNNATNNDVIKNIVKENNLEGKVVIATYNFEWKYQMYDENGKTINIFIDPHTNELKRISGGTNEHSVG